MVEKTNSTDLDSNGFDPILTKEDEENDSGVITIEKKKVKRPPLYKVLLHNDDYTTMEFVIFILQRVFGKDQREAQRVMLQVHNDGVGVCGIYTHEIAETKTETVRKLSKENGHPLKCTFERDD